MNLTADNKGNDDKPVFAPDSRSLVYLRTETPYYSGEFAKLWLHDLEAKTNTPLTESLDYAIGSAAFSPDGRSLWLTADERGVAPIFKINADGSNFSPVFKSGTSGGFDVAGNAAVFLNNSAERTDELFALDIAAN